MVAAAKRINGKDLGQNANANIILMGKINRIGSSGQSVEIETCDNQLVNVSLPSALEDNAEGYIEVWGRASSKTTVQADSIVIFPSEQCQEFDPKIYSNFLNIANVVGDKKWKLNANDTASYY